MEDLGKTYYCGHCGEMLIPYAIWSHDEYGEWLLKGGNILAEKLVRSSSRMAVLPGFLLTNRQDFSCMGSAAN